MNDIVNDKLAEWTHGLNGREAVISVFNHIRDIPYAVIPELRNPHNYRKIFTWNAGSCTPKHVLLTEMLNRLGFSTLYVVYAFHWSEYENIFPSDLRRMAYDMPEGNHLYCMVFVDDRMVHVDATIDAGLEKIGLPYNAVWDGQSDTLLSSTPCSEAAIYYPDEAWLAEPEYPDEHALSFYREMNKWLGVVRNSDIDELHKLING